VARLNGELIELDFDQQNQWDALIAMELQANDLESARGFLLSAGGMLPRRSASVLNNASDATDRELEVAALQFLNPGTRERYQALAMRRLQNPAVDQPVGDESDFLLLARAMVEAPESDAFQFILTGYALGLAGDLSPRMSKGAGALLDASRRDDYPDDLAIEIEALFASSFSMPAFRQRMNGADPAAFAETSAAAFRAGVSEAEAARVRTLLDDVGAISQATSRRAAAAMLTHAHSLSDMARLRLLAQSAGDRAAAAAKRLPRDGQLMRAAQGELTINRDLMAALAAAGAAFAGLLLVVIAKLIEVLAGTLRHWNDEDDLGGELVDLGFSGGQTWRPL
jgi:hypothetical protein